MESERKEAVERAWVQCERFLQTARGGYMARLVREGGPSAPEEPADLAKLGSSTRRCVRAAMRFPAVEAQFASPWCGAARRVLPCASPMFTATAMWGPLQAWCALDSLAQFVAGDGEERHAELEVDLFDRLRLREPLGQAFEALGLEGEEAWRGAARIKVLLLVQAALRKPAGADTEEPRPATDGAKKRAKEAAAEEGLLPRALWRDPDVQWLTGVHEADGHHYVIREAYEELLWWLQMPALLGLSSQAAVNSEAADRIEKAIADAMKAIEEAGYRVDEMLREDEKSAAEMEAGSDDEAENPPAKKIQATKE